MRKLLPLVAAMAAISLLAAIPSQARLDLGSEPNRYTYVSDTGTGPTYTSRLEDGGELPSPAGTLAPLGHIAVTPAGRSLTVEVDDFAALNGQQVPVIIGSSWGTLFNGCMTVREPVTFSGVVPGRSVRILVPSTSVLYNGQLCSAAGTVGVLTVNGAI